MRPSTASFDPYWSSETYDAVAVCFKCGGGNPLCLIGLACSEICFLSSTISLSISALRDLLPILLKFSWTLQARLSRRHLEQIVKGSWTTSHRSYKANQPLCANIIPAMGRNRSSKRLRKEIDRVWAHFLLAAFVTCSFHGVSPLFIMLLLPVLCPI